MTNSIMDRVFGSTGQQVFPLGLSATYWPGKKTVYKAIDEGINFFFGFGVDRQLFSVLREVIKSNRQQYVLATGAYNYLFGYQNLRKTLERRLRQFRTDYIDAFLFLGVTRKKEFPEKAREELVRLREEGKIHAIGMSCHDRTFAGSLAAQGALDVFMIRYNAAHRGAENDIFPKLFQYNPGIMSYTATRWSYLLRRPKGWPANGRIPTAGECYRFVLSNPHVHVCLTAPRNQRQLQENIDAVRQGPLSEDDMHFMKEFGDAVYRQYKWFM
jgi:aryl-alcohol dehydrogenase-like predicted oxidoreductase